MGMGVATDHNNKRAVRQIIGSIDIEFGSAIASGSLKYTAG
jgi:hypothetical protein